MLKARLPHKTRTELHRKRLMTHWGALGYAVQQPSLPAGDALLHFSTDSGWHGVIDLRRWLSAVAPDLAELASASCNFDELKQLFMGSPQPLQVEELPAELRFQKIIYAEPFPSGTLGLPDIAVMLTTSRGELWLADVEQLVRDLPGGPHASLVNIPLRLQFRIGISFLSLKWVKKVALGDVLLIQEQNNDLLIAGRIAGTYNQTEEGFMYEEDDDDDFFADDMEDIDEFTPEAPQEALHALDKVPVKLSFVLYEKNVSVGELQNIFQGTVINAEPGVENHIRVLANGLTIAKGQLIWIEDHPGVEITQLYDEAGNVLGQ